MELKLIQLTIYPIQLTMTIKELHQAEVLQNKIIQIMILV